MTQVFPRKRGQRVTAVIAWGKRPVPFRTRKLRPTAPMVLHSGGCGRVGRRRTYRKEKDPYKVVRVLFCFSPACTQDQAYPALDKGNRLGK